MSGVEGSPSELAELVRWSYEGEITGEAIFAGAADQLAEGDRRSKMRALEQLEARTKERIAPYLARAGVKGVDEPGLTAFGRQVGADMAQRPWDQFITEFDPLVQLSLTTYRKLLEIAPDDGFADLARALIEHEEAIESFARQELAGGTASIDPVVALLA